MHKCRFHVIVLKQSERMMKKKPPIYNRPIERGAEAPGVSGLQFWLRPPAPPSKNEANAITFEVNLCIVKLFQGYCYYR